MRSEFPRLAGQYTREAAEAGEEDFKGSYPMKRDDHDETLIEAGRASLEQALASFRGLTGDGERQRLKQAAERVLAAMQEDAAWQAEEEPF